MPLGTDGTEISESTRHITSRFEQACDEQMKLCDALEMIADSLPGDIDRQQCIHVARAMGALIDRAHDFEETELFPLVAQSSSPDRAGASTLERLKFEHYEDECFAEEVYEALMNCGAGQGGFPAEAAETLGYMLRGFFVSLRRHIAFEQEMVRTCLHPRGAQNQPNCTT